MKGKILVVEDEEYVRESLTAWLTRRGFSVVTTSSVEETVAERAQEGVDLVLTDLKLPGESGLALVERFANDSPEVPVVVLTGHGSVASAVECMKAGAADYLRKPVEPEELVLVAERVIGERRLRREVAYLRAGEPQATTAPVGDSAAWKRVLELAGIAAPVDTSVLLLGESGSGKEVVARYLHARSARAHQAFVSVNCAAIPMELFESEFFGHKKGAFTGAVADRDGRFQVADGGTLFLDEINSLPGTAQAKILRVLQDGAFERVGESRSTSVDVRLICASNADLAAEVSAGRFRPDLFYRINVMTIPIPPLRERIDDVLPLAESFLAELAARFGKPLRRISEPALELLEDYSWPGNVRELRNVIERGVLLSKGEALHPSDLPFSAASQVANTELAADGEKLHLRATLLATEKHLLQEAMQRAGGVKRRAAKLLGIDERNVAYFMKKHGLQ